MFCPGCGSEMKDTAVFCSNCGYSKSQGSAPKIDAAKPKKKYWILIGAALVVLAFLLFGNNGVNKSAENVAIAALESEYEVDIDKMVKVFPDFTIREMAVEYGLPADASRKQVASKIKQDYRYETPVEIKVLEATVVEEYDISEYTLFRELYDYMTEADYDVISKVAKVSLHYLADGESDSVKVTCIKMKNKWYLLRS